MHLKSEKFNKLCSQLCQAQETSVLHNQGNKLNGVSLLDSCENKDFRINSLSTIFNKCRSWLTSHAWLSTSPRIRKIE